MSKSTSNTQHPEYNEAAALQETLQAANDALKEVYVDSAKNDRYLSAQITIVVGGQSNAFILGGPQYQALCDFATCLAEENGYEIDFNTGCVQE